LDAHAHRKVKLNVKYDRSKAGARGLSLTCDLPEYGLKAGDRIEPSPSLRNVHNLFGLDKFPVAIVLWRCSTETRTKHRNPLMDPVIGMGPERLLVDLLHALFLGVVKDLSMSIVWELILTNAYDLPITASGPEKQASAIERIFVELAAFYKRWHAALPGELPRRSSSSRLA